MLKEVIYKLLTATYSIIIIVVAISSYHSFSTNNMEQYDIKGKSLLNFNYHFVGGILKNTMSNAGFEFNVFSSHHENQKRYEDIGKCLDEYIFELLEAEGLNKIFLNDDRMFAKEFVFATADIKTSSRIMIIIHGSGVVRAGQWSRRLIINDNLDTGTQLPYIREAMKRNYAVLILNTNLGDTFHASKAWKQIVEDSPNVKQVKIVAHSYGGVNTGQMFEDHPCSFTNLVNAIAFTDSVHSFSSSSLGNLFHKRAVNWVTSSDPLDTDISHKSGRCKIVSAGTKIHEYTSSSSIESVFKYFDDNELPGI